MSSSADHGAGPHTRMSDNQVSYLSWVDGPPEGPLSSNLFAITGWCFTPGLGEPKALRARIGSKLFEGRCGTPRPDVPPVLKDPTGANSGFEILLKAPSGSFTCELEASRDLRTWSTFKTLKFQAPARNRLSEVFSSLHFWQASLRGNPKAFLSLSPEQRRYRLGRLTNLGRDALTQFQQYEPRPLAPEKFPAPRRRRTPARFCIVTPSFNQGHFIGDTIRSVLTQPGVEVDYFVQDGASTDNTRDVLAELSKSHPETRFRWVSEPDKGQSDAIAKGFRQLRAAPGDLMAYLNSDDLLLPGALAFVADYFDRHPEVDAVYGHRINIDAEGREIGRWVSPRRSCDNLALHDLVPQETLFWRRSLWERIGGIDTSFRFAMDWDLLLRMQNAGATLARLPWFLGAFRIHEKQKTQSWIGDIGNAEMDRLRTRAHGRPISHEEVARSSEAAFFDSALCAALLRRGIRL